MPNTSTQLATSRRQPPLFTLAARLTARDLWLLEMLLEHSVLTTTSPNATRRA